MGAARLRPPSASSPRARPAPAPLGIGDRLFPHLGNPGYDVTRVRPRLHLPRQQQQAAATPSPRSTPGRPSGWNRSTSTSPTARSRSVEVNGAPAEFAQRGRGPGRHARRAPSPGRPDCGSPCGTPATRRRPRTPERLGAHRATGWPWPTRPTPRTGSSRATTTPPTRRCFTFRVTAPDGIHGRGQRAAGWRRPRTRGPPPGRTGPSTPWPPSWPRCPSAAPPSSHRERAARAARTRRGARRGPREAGALAEEDARADRVDGAEGRRATPSRRTEC